MAGNEELINEAKAIWGTLCEPNWQKDNLVALGKLLFARVPWEKLEPESKLLFIKAAVNARKTKASQTPAETPASEDKTVREKPNGKKDKEAKPGKDKDEKKDKDKDDKKDKESPAEGAAS